MVGDINIFALPSSFPIRHQILVHHPRPYNGLEVSPLLYFLFSILFFFTRKIYSITKENKAYTWKQKQQQEEQPE